MILELQTNRREIANELAAGMRDESVREFFIFYSYLRRFLP